MDGDSTIARGEIARPTFLHGENLVSKIRLNLSSVHPHLIGLGYARRQVTCSHSHTEPEVTMRQLTALLAILVVVVAAKADDEEKVPLDKLPKAVVEAVKAKFPKA